MSPQQMWNMRGQHTELYLSLDVPDRSSVDGPNLRGSGKGSLTFHLHICLHTQSLALTLCYFPPLSIELNTSYVMTCPWKFPTCNPDSCMNRGMYVVNDLNIFHKYLFVTKKHGLHTKSSTTHRPSSRLCL